MGIRERLLAARKKMEFICPVSGEELVYTDLTAKEVKDLTVKAYTLYPGSDDKEETLRGQFLSRMMLVKGLTSKSGEPVAEDLDDLEELGQAFVNAWTNRLVYFNGGLSEEEIKAVEGVVKKKE